MRNETRALYEQFTARIAQLNGVSNAANTFSVTPSIQQIMENKIMLSSEFLQAINIRPVDNLEGEKIGLGVAGTIARRTKTSPGNPRRPRSLAEFSSGKFRCIQTDFDTAIPYAQLDEWAAFPDFQKRLTDLLLQQQALDRIMIGWHGVDNTADDSNPTTNALLQDVNKGWLQQLREKAPARVMKEVRANSGKVMVGDAVDMADGYKNLDAMVMDAKNNLIHEVFRGRPDMVAIMGSDLLHDKYFPLVNKANDPTEQLALDMVISQKRIGGLPAVSVPFFPAGMVMVTPLKNLSIYVQKNGRRRHIREEPDYNQIADYQSSNEGYDLEVYEAACLIENIELVTA